MSCYGIPKEWSKYSLTNFVNPEDTFLLYESIKYAINKYYTPLETNLLDLGFGSNLVGLQLLKDKNIHHLHGIDIDNNCLKISDKNKIKLKIKSKNKYY